MKLLKIILVVIVGYAFYFATRHPEYKDYDIQDVPPPMGYKYSNYNWEKHRLEVEKDTELPFPPYLKPNLDSITSDAIETYSNQ